MLERVPAFGFEDKYLVDRSGQFWHLDGRKKNTPRQETGYRVLSLEENINGKRKQKVRRAHRVIWESFNGPIPNGMQIDHINRKRDDNRILNLRLATAAQNQRNRKPIVSSSHYAGVGYNQNGYRGRIRLNGKRFATDRFLCDTKAAIARELLIIREKDMFAKRNFESSGGNFGSS